MKPQTAPTCLATLLLFSTTAHALPKLVPRACTSSSAVQRKEYGNLTDDEKLAYVNGIQCLLNSPSQYADGVVPAATNRYFDFAATHVNLTYNVHFSGIFLSWHRHFVYLLEQALKDECGFPAEMGVPYWDWTLYADLADSPIWDGSDTSLGSNGSATDLCVESGPFSNMTTTFESIDLDTMFGATPPSNWTEASPGCLKRNLGNSVIAANNNQTEVDSLLASPNITWVLRNFNSAAYGDGFTEYGMHGGGHGAMGGTETNFFASPQDPGFFLHHSMIDRLWTMWQDANPDQRYTYNGTSTLLNPPNGTPEVDNSTVMDFGILESDTVTVGDVGDPMAGRYCYIYV